MALTGEVGLGHWSRKFRELATALEGPDVMKQIVQAVKDDVTEEFRGSYDPDGRPWQAPVYRDGQPLVVSGRLQGAADGSLQGHYEFLGLRAVVVGIDGTYVPYAAANQFGATVDRPERRRAKPWVFTTRDGFKVFTRKIRSYRFTIPARPFYGFGERLAGRVTAVILRTFRRVVGG